MDRREKARLNHTIHAQEDIIKKLHADKQEMTDLASLVHIYFKDTGVILFSRDQLYSVIDVIGECWIRSLAFRITHC